MKHLIYADNAATTKLDKDALEAMLPFLRDEYGNASQPYSFARKSRKALADARTTIAKCIGADSDEIFFTSGGTESDNWAIKGVAYGRVSDTVITSRIEHHAVLRACSAAARMGVPVQYLHADATGTVLPDTLSAKLTSDTSIVSIMMVNNEIGTIEPIEKLAAVAHSKGALFHTDAVQAVGHIPIDVDALGVDMLSASAHKFNGPKGVGFLYVRKGTEIYPYIDGGAQEFGMRGGTENVAAIVGMAVALKKNCDEMAETSARLRKLEDRFFEVLTNARIDFRRNGSESRAPGNINISIKEANGEMLLHRLDLNGISVSTGSACDSVNTQISHVIREIGVPSEYAEGTIRVSLGRDNTETDAVAIAEALVRILSGRACDDR